MATGEMLWSTQSGYLTNNKLNKTFQKAAQPLLRFRQFVKFKEAFGKNKGESVNWLKVANVSSYGGKLVETNTMHETRQVLSWGTLSVDEYGNSIPFTGKIEALSEFDIVDIMKEGLLDDFVKCLDGNIEREFNSCALRYVGTATDGYVLTTNGVTTATNSSVFNSYHIRKMATELKKRNVPGFSDINGDYVCIASLEALEGMAGALETVNSYTETGFRRLVEGEIGRYHGVTFVEDRFATRHVYDATARTATAISWTNAKALVAYMFGSPTVREAIVIPEEIRQKVVTDYGRSKGLAWYFLGGHRIEWNDEPNARIIKWDSGA